MGKMPDGLKVSAVMKDSIAAEMEIEPGDEILQVDQHNIQDILDLQYWTAEEEFTLIIQKKNKEIWELEIVKEPEELLGIEVSSVGRDGLMKCQNNCVFCFVRQMPPGMRASLYDLDDDYRMSVNQGSYITLSNLEDKDFQRIIDMHLSPLYISVHAWNPAVREKLMRNRQAGKLAEQINRLAEAGLVLHTQIVLVPGYNDREVLQETVENLEAFFPQVQSIGIVPVGLTKYRDRLLELRTVTPEAAREVLEHGIEWQKKYRKRTGQNLVYFSDEFYMLAGKDFPSYHEYDDFPQLENGIGMARKFQDEIQMCIGDLPERIQERKIHIVTGVSAAAYFRSRIAELPAVQGLHITVHEIANTFFGTTVTVAGLLTAQDIAAQLDDLQGEYFLLPKVMLRAGEKVFLDGYDVQWLTKQVNGIAVVVENDGQSFIEGLLGITIGGLENE
jgi:putative radical SAM enzyme (TIGR03279 family)